ISDATSCTYPGVTEGACDRGVCHPVVCGNGKMEPGEVCDDGNARDGDGCSSGCRVELPGWSQLRVLLVGTQAHAMTYDSARDRLVVFGGLSPTSDPV